MSLERLQGPPIFIQRGARFERRISIPTKTGGLASLNFKVSSGVSGASLDIDSSFTAGSSQTSPGTPPVGGTVNDSYFDCAIAAGSTDLSYSRGRYCVVLDTNDTIIQWGEVVVLEALV